MYLPFGWVRLRVSRLPGYVVPDHPEQL